MDSGHYCNNLYINVEHSEGLALMWFNEILLTLFENQQSSTDIWHAVCAAVKAACTIANVAGEEVKGVGFAATCSLGM